MSWLMIFWALEFSFIWGYCELGVGLRVCVFFHSGGGWCRTNAGQLQAPVQTFLEE